MAKDTQFNLNFLLKLKNPGQKPWFDPNKIYYSKLQNYQKLCFRLADLNKYFNIGQYQIYFDQARSCPENVLKNLELFDANNYELLESYFNVYINQPDHKKDALEKISGLLTQLFIEEINQFAGNHLDPREQNHKPIVHALLKVLDTRAQETLKQCRMTHEELFDTNEDRMGEQDIYAKKSQKARCKDLTRQALTNLNALLTIQGKRRSDFLGNEYCQYLLDDDISKAKYYFQLADLKEYFELDDDYKYYYKRARDLSPNNPFYALRYAEVIDNPHAKTNGLELLRANNFNATDYHHWFEQRWISKEDQIGHYNFDIHRNDFDGKPGLFNNLNLA